jgi:hypothetical protein
MIRQHPIFHRTDVLVRQHLSRAPLRFVAAAWEFPGWAARPDPLTLGKIIKISFQLILFIRNYWTAFDDLSDVAMFCMAFKTRR